MSLASRRIAVVSRLILLALITPLAACSKPEKPHFITGPIRKAQTTSDALAVLPVGVTRVCS